MRGTARQLVPLLILSAIGGCGLPTVSEKAVSGFTLGRSQPDPKPADSLALAGVATRESPSEQPDAHPEPAALARETAKTASGILVADESAIRARLERLRQRTAAAAKPKTHRRPQVLISAVQRSPEKPSSNKGPQEVVPPTLAKEQPAEPLQTPKIVQTSARRGAAWFDPSEKEPVTSRWNNDSSEEEVAPPPPDTNRAGFADDGWEVQILAAPKEEPEAPTELLPYGPLEGEPFPTTSQLPALEATGFPVDLPTVLRLTGTQNWAVQLACEKIEQAEAAVTAAEALWLPNLNFGLGYNKHEGQIQATNGDIVDISRGSVFVGAGAKVANAPLNGASGGPARLFVDLPITDALFQPLVARQLACAARFRQNVEFNDAQLEAAMAYFDLVSAQGQVAAVQQNIADAESLLRTTQTFVAAGKAASGEVDRVEVVLANQRQLLVEAQLRLNLASNELIRIIRLDPAQLTADTPLFSADDHLIPIELVPEVSDLEVLIAQGQQSRPEVGELNALVQARVTDVQKEEMRPFLPSVNLGVSGGAFGGGSGGDLDSFSGRVDVDALLVWEVRNLGFGENAARRDRDSLYQQAILRSHQLADRIAAEVREAWHRMRAARQRIELTRTNVDRATRVLEVNLDRIRGLEGLPLEALQALRAVSASRIAYLQAIVDYNKAQSSLLRAVGQPAEQ